MHVPNIENNFSFQSIKDVYYPNSDTVLSVQIYRMCKTMYIPNT